MFSLVRMAVAGGAGTTDVPAGPDGGGGQDGGGVYPGGTTTVTDWVSFDGCSSTADTLSPNLDIEATLPGAETTVTKYENGCPSITEVVLWTTQGGSHLPGFNQSFVPDVVAYLLAHPRP